MVRLQDFRTCFKPATHFKWTRRLTWVTRFACAMHFMCTTHFMYASHFTCATRLMRTTCFDCRTCFTRATRLASAMGFERTRHYMRVTHFALAICLVRAIRLVCTLFKMYIVCTTCLRCVTYFTHMSSGRGTPLHLTTTSTHRSSHANSFLNPPVKWLGPQCREPQCRSTFTSQWSSKVAKWSILIKAF